MRVNSANLKIGQNQIFNIFIEVYLDLEKCKTSFLSKNYFLIIYHSGFEMVGVRAGGQTKCKIITVQ